METQQGASLVLNLRRTQVRKAHALKWFFHLFNTYGIKRRAW